MDGFQGRVAKAVVRTGMFPKDRNIRDDDECTCVIVMMMVFSVFVCLWLKKFLILIRVWTTTYAT
jgi:hypothetical protein